MTEDNPVVLGAIVAPDSSQADELLAWAAEQCGTHGKQVRGVLMEMPPHTPDQPRPKAVLRDLHTGERYSILQDRGPLSRGCCLDTDVLSRASVVLRRALAEKPDLVIVNRFGSSEAEGDGFTEELLALIEAGIPLLLIVNTRYLEAWRHFNGGMGDEIACEQAAVAEWLGSRLSVDAC
ncbi:MAG: DUF2478 domain-containing protein [Corticimicrobacter sp.]|uniref:DUF2478 domain-containing protein n=1 Tax=Corticimicrobacter sp. TaxID=2678536 RepID=UPI0032D9D4C7